MTADPVTGDRPTSPAEVAPEADHAAGRLTLLQRIATSAKTFVRTMSRVMDASTPLLLYSAR